MLNSKDSFSIMTDFNNLYAAHLSCRKGKRWKDSVAEYDINGLKRTIHLQKLLESGHYYLSPYNCFTLNERGKVRNIKSIKYQDRIVQKNLMDNILSPIVEKTFVDTNCASLKNKGTDYALKKLRHHLQRQVRKWGPNGYILICDMKGYFDSVPHYLLKEFYENKFEDKQLLNLINHIHDSIPGGKGVPLGNQLSQLDALLALSPLDHIIKEQMYIEGFTRYMDDFYLIHENKKYLNKCLEGIKQWVESRDMKLNPKKTKIVTMRQGINFLGFHFYVTETGKVVQKLLPKSKKNIRRKMKKMKKLLDEGKCTFKACRESYNGWRAHAQRGDTYYLLREMDERFNDLFKEYIQKEKEEKLKQKKKRRKRNGKKT